MKKICILLVLVLCSCLKGFCQATSLTVDCQTPGWLSSKIDYSDQQTLENLTIKGFINGADIQFIRELNLNRNLSGVINLEEANIVLGGDSYGPINSYYIKTKDNTLPNYMFAQLNNIRKVILPKSLTSFDGNRQFTGTCVDTLIINGSMENLDMAGAYDNKLWNIRCIYFPEGLKNIDFGILLACEEIYFPSTLSWVKGTFSDHYVVIHLSSLRPDTITAGNSINKYYNPFTNGIIYVPKGTKSLYESSIFSKLEIKEVIPVEGVSLDKSKTLYIGDVIKIDAMINPANALNQSVKWESSNNDVASVTEDGLVTAISYGTTDITATTEDGGFKAICEVNVYEHTTGVKMAENTTIHIGDQFELNAQTLPLSTSDGKINYSSNDTDVATVSEVGEVKGKKKGTCTITATSVDGGYTAQCVVSVLQPVEAISLEKHTLNMNVGDVESLYAQVIPLTADNKKVKWSSSDENIVVVSDDGDVTAKKIGKATITAVSEDNPEASDVCKVTVNGGTYVLTYMVDGKVYKTVGYDYDVSITPEAEPTKEGYTFSGWSEIPETMPAEDVTVSGSFTINKYKVTYMLDGVEYKTFEVEYGANIPTEAAPAKEGYTFSGWSGVPDAMPAHDVTINGSFGINTYRLTYMVDGVEYKAFDLAFGAAVTPETEPKKEGYTFSGWSEVPETMPDHDVTVTGTFTINKYKLTYLIDGESYKTFEVEYGATITPEEAPTKEGHTFSGWSEIPETMPAKDITVNGSFTVNKYKLIYIVDGEEYKACEIDYGTTITPETEPSKEGYTFSGWSEIPETMPARNVVVTGSFTVNTYTLTYQVDGEDYKTYKQEYGSAITPEAEPASKEGHTFSGWSEIPETMPAHDVMVTGKFTVNKYVLIYLLDGKEYKTLEVDYGSTIVPEAEPAPKEGYTFSGWEGLPETMPAQIVVVTGTYTVNKYKLTYMIGDETYKEVEIEYGSTIPAEPQPDGDYVRFVWVGVPETMPAHDVTVYADFETGILDVMALQGVRCIYSPNGKRISKLQKGVNIVVMNDGSVKKVYVK